MDRYQQKLSAYKDVSTSGVVLASDDFSSTPKSLIAAITGETIYVQRITLGVTTDNAATQLFEDTSGTPIKVAGTKASPGIGPIVFDFGADGFKCTESKGLELKSSAAGLAFSYTVQAYQKRTATLTGNKRALLPANL